jgi:hypothetical protein
MDIFNSAPQRKRIHDHRLNKLKKLKIRGVDGHSLYTNLLDPNVVKHTYLLHDKNVIVSADKAPNNIVFYVTHVT